jgi:hypothetical protein
MDVSIRVFHNSTGRFLRDFGFQQVIGGLPVSPIDFEIHTYGSGDDYGSRSTCFLLDHNFCTLHEFSLVDCRYLRKTVLHPDEERLFPMVTHLSSSASTLYLLELIQDFESRSRMVALTWNDSFLQRTDMFELDTYGEDFLVDSGVAFITFKARQRVLAYDLLTSRPLREYKAPMEEAYPLAIGTHGGEVVVSYAGKLGRQQSWVCVFDRETAVFKRLFDLPINSFWNSSIAVTDNHQLLVSFAYNYRVFVLE